MCLEIGEDFLVEEQKQSKRIKQILDNLLYTLSIPIIKAIL